MNDVQRKLAEDNLKLVYFTISNYYPTLIGDSDIVSSGYMGLCKATLKWDESRGKFTTFAIKCIRNSIRIELRNRRKQPDCISLETPISDNESEVVTLEDAIEGDEIDFTKLTTDDFLKSLTDRERVVFDLKTKGYSRSDILSLTGLNRGVIFNILKSIRRKYLKMK